MIKAILRGIKIFLQFLTVSNAGLYFVRKSGVNSNVPTIICVGHLFHIIYHVSDCLHELLKNKIKIVSSQKCKNFKGLQVNQEI